MTGELGMTGPGVAVSYGPPTAPLYGPWVSDAIGFGWNAGVLRLRVDDTDVGWLQPANVVGSSYVLKIGDTMTGELAMTGPAVAVSYSPPTALLHGVWLDDPIGFGYDGVSALRVRANDVDIGYIRPTTTAPGSGYVSRAGDVMTGDLSMTGTGKGISYDPPTTLVYGAWQELPIGFGYDGANIRMRVQDVDVGVLRASSSGSAVDYAMKWSLPAGTTGGTIFDFKIPAENFPTGDFYWRFEISNLDNSVNRTSNVSSYNLRTSTALTPQTMNIQVSFESDISDGNGMQFNLIGNLAVYNESTLTPHARVHDNLIPFFISMNEMPLYISNADTNGGLRFQLELQAGTVTIDIPFMLTFRLHVIGPVNMPDAVPTMVRMPTVGGQLPV